MDNFVVSARKYRPLGFEEVVGQSHITTTLENAIKSNHLGQALLFCGPRGVGKTTCARILAKTINDFESETGDSTNNFNIFELDAASNNSVEDIRNLIDQVRYPPQQGKYKVYIIDEVHMLSNQAFNAFLKTLEEPPEYAIFILATTEKHKVIPTILSRCQIYDFNRIEVIDIVKQLEKIATSEKVEAEKEALHLIAQKADGALRDALSIFDLITTFSSEGKITYQDTIKNLHILDYDYYFRLVDDLLNQNMASALLLFDEILRNGFDGNNFLNGFQQHLRNLLIAKDEKTIVLLDAADNLMKKYQDQALTCSSSFLLSALNISNKFELGYKQSKNQRLHVELCLMKLAHLPNALSLTAPEEGAKKKRLAHSATASPSPASQVQESSSPKENASPDTVKSESQDLAPVEKITPTANQEPAAQPINEEPTKPRETPSIFGRKKKLVENEPQIVTPVLEKKHEPFTDEDLNKSWDAFKVARVDAGDTDRLILNKKLVKGDGDQVLISLASSLESSFLEKLETLIIQHLRATLSNDHITLKASLNQVKDEGNKLYTNKDKYEEMVRQNPNLKELKERLGLDYEF